MKKFLLFTTIIIPAAFIAQCKKDGKKDYLSTATCSPTDSLTNTYIKNVSAILDSNCAYSGCHSSSSKAGGVALDTYAKAKKDFQDGESLCTINYDCERMPQGQPKLSVALIADLTCWVKNGCPE
jgi:hypothetical protein